jgi:hypothetical protein
VNPAIGIFGFAEVRKDLVAHSTGLERATRLDILQLEENAASSGARKVGRLDKGSLNPWRLEVGLVVLNGRHEASHSGGVEVDQVGEREKRSSVEGNRSEGKELREVKYQDDKKIPPKIGICFG